MTLANQLPDEPTLRIFGKDRPQLGGQLKGMGFEVVGSSRSELDAFRRDQRKRISEIVKASGIDVK